MKGNVVFSVVYLISIIQVMALTFCRSLGPFMRFGRRQFDFVANNVARRKCLRMSFGEEHRSKAIALSASFLRSFSSAQPCPQKET